ncbi:MAG: TetR/AcrR family transcriptional regulator [Syntrophales bacterium]|nr:TetR/AcrR family transcriptional regulator [Syntrophales bacterium]
MSPDNKSATTRNRLLEVAEALFAQKGYDAVSVREITNAARCNLAAVNYHFGNKKTLYMHMFRERWMSRAQRILTCFEENLAGRDETSSSSVIQALAEAFIKGPLTDEERLYHFQLMTRELIKPTDAFEMVATETMRPFLEKLGQRLKPCLSDTGDEERTLLNILSIISMVIYFNFARVPVSKIIGHAYDEPFKDRLVQHIVQFSLSGIPLREDTR